MHRSEVSVGGRLHGKQRDKLEEVVLDHIPQTARAFIKRTAVFHSEIFRQGYLDAGDVVAVPDRLQERIGEAEIEDVHDRLFPEVVVDSEDGVFREYRPRHFVEFLRGGQVASERLFHDDSRVFSQFRGAEFFDHRLK